MILGISGHLEIRGESSATASDGWKQLAPIASNWFDSFQIFIADSQKFSPLLKELASWNKETIIAYLNLGLKISIKPRNIICTVFQYNQWTTSPGSKFDSNREYSRKILHNPFWKMMNPCHLNNEITTFIR